MNSMYKETENSFYKFLSDFTHYLCGRCQEDGVHSNEKMLKFLENNGSDSEVDNWLNDLEHGFVHGLSVCFVAWLLNNKVSSKTLASCLLHDFLRSNGIDDNHDILLRNIFSHLNEETYRHSNPLDTDTNRLLIIADREELKRYGDYRKWIDTSLFTHSLTEEQSNILNTYYQHIRPGICDVFSHYDEIWLRHGPEGEMKSLRFLEIKDYPDSSGNVGGNNYSVELDKMPLNGCCGHGRRTKYLWSYIYGVIPLSKFKNLGGHLFIINKDHYFADINMPKHELVYFYDNGYLFHNFFKGAKNIKLLSRRCLDKMCNIQRLIEIRLKVNPFYSFT